MGNIQCLSETENIYKYNNRTNGWSESFVFRLSGMNDENILKLQRKNINNDPMIPLLTSHNIKYSTSKLDLSTLKEASDENKYDDEPLMPDRFSLQRSSTMNAALIAAHKTMREAIGEPSPTKLKSSLVSKSWSKGYEIIEEQDTFPITRRSSNPQTITIERTKSGGNYVISRRSIREIYPDFQEKEEEKDNLYETLSNVDSLDNDTIVTLTIATPSKWDTYPLIK